MYSINKYLRIYRINDNINLLKKIVLLTFDII
jgi:hypothetical protein